MNNQDFGKFIATLRKDKGLTQKELGDKLNLTDKAISRWENGKSYPDIETLEKLANELDISINELISCKRAESQKEAEIETARAYLGNIRTIKSSKSLIAVILSILIVVLSMSIAFCIYGNKDNTYALNDIVISDNKLNLNIITTNRITNTSIDDNNGVITLNVRTSPIIISNAKGKNISYISKSNITKIQSKNGRVFWESGEEISQKINDIFNAKVKYIGNNSDVGNLLSVINILEELKCNDYSVHLITDKRPYGLEVYGITPKDEIFATISNETYEQKIKSTAYILLACIENADYVKFDYTLPNGCEDSYKLTVEDANDSLYIIKENESIKDFASSHYELKLLTEDVASLLVYSKSFEYLPLLDATNKETFDKLNNNPIDKKYLDIQNNSSYFDIHDEAENYLNWAKAYEKQYKYLYDTLKSYAEMSDETNAYQKLELQKAIESMKDYPAYSEKIATLYVNSEDMIAGFCSGRDYTYCYIYLNDIRRSTLHLAELAYFMNINFEWLV